jgi:CHAT domain-containing protein
VVLDLLDAAWRDPLGGDVVGLNPGVRSSLCLAGVNRGAAADPAGASDDGHLTAVEVAALDLRAARLVVLSACETGLGRAEAGEGVLGLQRAFQVAGSRSVVASLWKVPDRATQVLMEHFYDGLWRPRPLARAEALRDAQLWMLRNAAGRPELLRGLERAGPVPPPADGRLPPRYWAAFVLSGDWR